MMKAGRIACSDCLECAGFARFCSPIEFDIRKTWAKWLTWAKGKGYNADIGE